jgi:hypothetical protein
MSTKYKAPALQSMNKLPVALRWSPDLAAKLKIQIIVKVVKIINEI